MNVDDLYSARIQKTFDEDHEEIVSIIKENPDRVLKLINYYKGLPFSYPATIAAIDRGIVDLDVRPEQAFAIEKSRSTFIRSPIFKHDVFARVQYVNVKRMAASFIKFGYVEIMAERRNFIRMVPDPHPNTLIKASNGIFEGIVFDLSLSGLNITVSDSCPLEIDAQTSVRFMVKNEEQTLGVQVVVPATLIDIVGDALPRAYKFTIKPDKMLERQLAQYIVQRQVEIIKEMKTSVF